MHRFFTFLFLAVIQSLTAQSSKVDYIFTDVNVITMKDDAILRNQTVVIHDGKIIEITTKSSYQSENTVDAKGTYLLPSMADAHIHFPDSKQELEKVMKLNLINGITKLRSMRGEWQDVELKEQYNNEHQYYPKLYLTAPPFHRSYDLTEEEIDSYVIKAKDNGIDQIKVLSIKNQHVFELLSETCKKHNMPLGGHFPVVEDGVMGDEILFQSFYTSIEHLGGLIGEPDKVEDRINYIKRNELFICPTMQWYAIGYGQYGVEEMMDQRGMQYIPEAIKKDWAEKSINYRMKLGKEEFEAEKQKYALEMQERFNMTKRLNDQGVKLLLSPDSSSKFIVPGFGLLEEMKLYKKAGLSNFDILKSATTNFALFFKENYGIIAPGKDADFILVKENPLEDLKALEQVEAVFYNKFYLDKNKLTEIAKSVEPN